jgi:hypothetical protein
MAGKLTTQGTGILLVTANVGSLFEDVSCLCYVLMIPVRWFCTRDVNVEPDYPGYCSVVAVFSVS